MPEISSPAPPPRGAFWKWWVCGLLLLATMINYMDRLTLNQLSKAACVTEARRTLPGNTRVLARSSPYWAITASSVVQSWLTVGHLERELASPAGRRALRRLNDDRVTARHLDFR